MKVFLYTTFALIAFAFNSILCRLALRGAEADAAGFTTVRLVSGAVALAVISCLATKGGNLSGSEGAQYGKDSTVSTLPTGRVSASDSEVEQREIALAIIGRPNVGKSSFVNALMGEDRMIVRIAFRIKSDQRIDPGRLDAAPDAVRVLMLDDPFKRMLDSRVTAEGEAGLLRHLAPRGRFR